MNALSTFLLPLLLACSDGGKDSGPTGDGGATGDGGSTTDSGGSDTGDGGGTDGGGTDGGSGDGGSGDGGAPDFPDTPAGEFLSALDPLAVDTIEGVGFAAYMSAGMVGTMSLEPLRYADEDASFKCPRVNKEKGSGLRVFEGGCTDNRLSSWVGQAEVRDEVYTLDGFGFERPHPSCKDTVQRVVVTGTVTPEPEGGAWEIDVISDVADADAACFQQEYQVAISYRLEREVDEEVTVFDGQGYVGFADVGWARAVTTSEVLNTCPTEPDHGKTEVSSDGPTLEILYDGADRCSDLGDALMYLDGDKVGSYRVPACATAAASPAAMSGVLALLLGLGRRRRAR